MAAPVLVVLDCDGTLVDAQAGIIATMQAAFAAAGQKTPEAAAIRRTVGLALEPAVRQLLPGCPPDLAQAIAEGYREAFVERRQRQDHHEPLYPGARAALDALVAAGVILGIATGKGRRGLAHTLERHDLRRYFDVLQTADDAPGKPAPDMLLQAMAAVGGEARRTMMVGDTSFDMAMAVAARVVPVGVAWGYHPAVELTSSGARTVLTEFAALPRLVATWFETDLGG